MPAGCLACLSEERLGTFGSWFLWAFAGVMMLWLLHNKGADRVEVSMVMTLIRVLMFERLVRDPVVAWIDTNWPELRNPPVSDE